MTFNHEWAKTGNKVETREVDLRLRRLYLTPLTVIEGCTLVLLLGFQMYIKYLGKLLAVH